MKAVTFILALTALAGVRAYAGQPVRNDCISVQSSPMMLEGQVVNGEVVLSLTNNCGTAVNGMMTWSNGGALGFYLGAGQTKPQWYTSAAGATLKYYVCAAPASPVAPNPGGGDPAPFFITYNTPGAAVACQ